MIIIIHADENVPLSIKICRPHQKRKTEKRGDTQEEWRDTQANAYIHQSSDLSSYEPFDLERPHTCCGSHVFDLLYEQLRLLIEQQKRIMTMNDLGDHSVSTISRVMYSVMPHPGQPGTLHFDEKNISEFLDD